jgi:hypothetical protein
MLDAEISRLDHCTDRQLKELLALASPSAKSTRDWLLEIGDTEQLERLLTDMCAGTEQSGGELLQAVCSAETPVEDLIAIKRIAKRLAVSAEAPAQNAAATLLYHLSLASALANHSQDLSSKNPSERLPLYKDLAAELSDDRLAAIFEGAVARLLSEKP